MSNDRVTPEIARLKAENDSLVEQFKALRAICYNKDSLITELAGALGAFYYRKETIDLPIYDLLQRAKEAAE